jgi:hypothetical protein
VKESERIRLCSLLDLALVGVPLCLSSGSIVDVQANDGMLVTPFRAVVLAFDVYSATCDVITLDSRQRHSVPASWISDDSKVELKKWSDSDASYLKDRPMAWFKALATDSARVCLSIIRAFSAIDNM